MIFTALHALHASRSSHEKVLCLSVCLSVCQTRGLWQNERNLCPHSYTTWKNIYHSFVTRRMVGEGDLFCLKFSVKLTRWSKNSYFQSLFARNASAVTPSEKSSINTNRKSTARFPMSRIWISYIAPKPPTTYTNVIQSLFMYLLNGPASLHSLHVIWTSAIIDAHA